MRQRRNGVANGGALSRRGLRWGAGRAALPLLAVLAGACGPDPDPSDPAEAPVGRETAALEDRLRARISDSGAEVGLFYHTRGTVPDSVAVSADLRMHAASTMKVPVMMRLFRDEEEGRISLHDRIPVTDTFASIVDGSPFRLPRESDSDSTFYDRMGESVSYRELTERMITRSSNLATNLLIQAAVPGRVTELLRSLGADSMQVVRGVEDLRAFEAGLSNTTTARDLGRALLALLDPDAFSAPAREEMLGILERQEFRELIPAGLPPGTRVANKTGWITGHHHDAAVIFPPDSEPYVLVILVRGPTEPAQAQGLISALSREVWEFHSGNGSPSN